MKKILVLFIVATALSLTGCINIIEEIFLNKNGSGQYSITMDASAVMEGGGLRSMLQSMGDDAEALSELDGQMEVDTVIFFKNAPDSITQNLSHPELLDKISLRQIVSEEKEIMKTIFTFDFEQVGQIDLFRKDFAKLGGNSADMGGMGGLMDGMLIGKTADNVPLFVKTKKMLTRNKTTMVGDLSGEDSNMEMMKMMLSGATYQLIYHLPGKVKKTNLQNSRVEGKDIFVEVDLLDSMEGKADLSGWIKYKGK